MSVYMTEEEQLEAIKKWWQKYNGLITVILSILLLAFTAYRYWTWHEAKVGQQASAAYERMMMAFSEQDTKAVRSYAKLLILEYSDSIYADAARLSLAKLLVKQEKYSQAEKQLQYLVDHSRHQPLREVAKMRLSRVLLAEKLYDKALQSLDTIHDEAYLPVVHELKGDIYVATGQYPQAQESYKMAIQQAQVKGVGNIFLEMKSNQLAALAQSMQEPAAKTGLATNN